MELDVILTGVNPLIRNLAAMPGAVARANTRGATDTAFQARRAMRGIGASPVGLKKFRVKAATETHPEAHVTDASWRPGAISGPVYEQGGTATSISTGGALIPSAIKGEVAGNIKGTKRAIAMAQAGGFIGRMKSGKLGYFMRAQAATWKGSPGAWSHTLIKLLYTIKTDAEIAEMTRRGIAEADKSIEGNTMIALAREVEDAMKGGGE